MTFYKRQSPPSVQISHADVEMISIRDSGDIFHDPVEMISAGYSEIICTGPLEMIYPNTMENMFPVGLLADK